jgi:gliding motility-associated lipoprotein GldB
VDKIIQMKLKSVVFILFILTSACGKKKQCIPAPDVSKINATVNWVRLDQELKSLQTKEEIKLFLDRHPLFAEKFLDRSQMPHDSLIINDFYRLINDPLIDSLYMDVDRVFADTRDIEEDLRSAFQHVKYYYPDFKEPTVYTLVTGFSTDLFVSDSLIVIGLEYFLGDESTYRPQIPQYILQRYKRETLVPSILLMLSDKYNRTNLLDRTLLAEMTYYGRSYYFTKQMLPCTPDSLIIGYTAQQIEDAEQNEDLIWGHFVERELLFKNKAQEIERYVGERPRVQEISDRAPGRIGRWVGWQIVDRYAERTNATLPEIMEKKEAQEIFEQSRYKPRRR